MICIFISSCSVLPDYSCKYTKLDYSEAVTNDIFLDENYDLTDRIAIQKINIIEKSGKVTNKSKYKTWDNLYGEETVTKSNNQTRYAHPQNVVDAAIYLVKMYHGDGLIGMQIKQYNEYGMPVVELTGTIVRNKNK